MMHDPRDQQKARSRRVNAVSPDHGPCDGRRKYAPPRLVDYGTLAELTKTNDPVTAGDSLGGSFAF